MTHPLVLAQVAVPAIAIVSWITPTQAESIIAVLMIFALGASAVGGVFSKSKFEREKLDRDARVEREKVELAAKVERDRAELMAEVERIKTLDAVRKESLSLQNEDLRDLIAKAAEESLANQEKMRANQHEVVQLLNVRNLELENLHQQLHEAHEDTSLLSRQVAEANTRNAALVVELVKANKEVSSLTAVVARLNRDEAVRGDKVEHMVHEIHQTMKATAESGPHPTLDLSAENSRAVLTTVLLPEPSERPEPAP